MEEYLYESKDAYDGSDRVATFRAIRATTRYERGGRRPAGPDDTIDWTSARTAGEIADRIGVDSVFPHYMDQHRHHLTESRQVGGQNRYATPADIAHELDDFILPQSE